MSFIFNSPQKMQKVASIKFNFLWNHPAARRPEQSCKVQLMGGAAAMHNNQICIACIEK